MMCCQDSFHFYRLVAAGIPMLVIGIVGLQSVAWAMTHSVVTLWDVVIEV